MRLAEPGAAALAVRQKARAGHFAEIREMAAPSLRAMVTAEALRAGWAAEFARQGPVPGTLSLPRQPGPLPGVLLLSGSGPQNRDETIGRNKPLRDLAWGLASRGIAVLRVAPRVAAAEPAVAGLVIMAGGTQPLHRSARRQFRYLASLDPAGAPALQPVIETLTRQAELVDSGRDYQATVTDDLAGWPAGLAGRPDVTVNVCEADNHLCCPWSGPSSPAEYEPAQRLDPAVVADIADWPTAAGARS